MKDSDKLTNAIKSASQSMLTAKSTTATEDVEMSGETSNLQSEIKVNGRVVPLKSIKLREAFAALTDIEK